MAVSGVDTGLVVGQFITGLVDGADVNDEPDMVGARGTFEFAPAINYVPVPLGDPNPFTLLRDPFLAVLDDEGYLCTPDPDFPTKPGKRGLRLFATDSPTASVKNWTWKVTPKFVNKMGMPIASYIAPFDIAVPTDGIVDLATAVKIPSSPGLGTEQVVVYATQAQDAAKYAARQAEYAAEEASSAGISAWEATDIAQQAMAVSALAEQVATGVQKQATDGEFIPDITVKVNTVANPADDVWMSDIIRDSPLVSATLREVFPTSMKGDAGGLVTSSKVYSTQQANNLTTPGYYYQMSGVTDTALNWPASFRGIMAVYGDPADLVTQEFNPQRVTDAQDRFFYRRTRVGGAWSGWRTYTSQRVDNTAGRAIYTWDHTTSREQLIYGDTGWRDISTNLVTANFVLNSSQPRCYIRRENHDVQLVMRLQASPELVAANSGKNSTLLPLVDIPTGFTEGPITYALTMSGIAHSGNNIEVLAVGPTHSSAQLRVAGTTDKPWASSQVLGFNLHWKTNAVWPTTLPGTANDIIPNL